MNQSLLSKLSQKGKKAGRPKLSGIYLLGPVTKYGDQPKAGWMRRIPAYHSGIEGSIGRGPDEGPGIGQTDRLTGIASARLGSWAKGVRIWTASL